MRHHFRRALHALLAIALAGTALVATSSPAQAVAPTTGAIDVTRWQVGSTTAATLTWTNPAQTTSVMVRSPWPWGASWAADETVTATGDTQTASNVARTITCTDSGSNTVVFTLETATVAGGATVNCRFKNTGELSINQNLGQFKGVWIENVTTASGAHISVAFASGLVTAPAAPRNDTWLIGQYNASWDASTQAEVATQAFAPAGGKPFDWADAMTPNSSLELKLNDELTTATCTAPTFSITPKLYEFSFSHFGDAEATAKKFGGVLNPASNETPTVKVGIPGDAFGRSIKCSLTVYSAGAISEISTTRKLGMATPASAPRNVKATAIPTGILIEWQPPANTGGAVSHYLVQANPGGRICITRALTDEFPTSCTLGYAADNTTYAFTVQALNPAGWGERSTPSAAVESYDIVLRAANRKKTFLGLTQEVNIRGTASGLLAGTKLTGLYRLNSGGWKTVTITVNKDGSFRHTLKLYGKNRSATVEFKVSYTNPALLDIAMVKHLVTATSTRVVLKPLK